MQRREAKKGVIKWFSLQWPREKNELDLQEKILVQNTRNELLKIRIIVTITNQAVYATQGVNFIISKGTDYNLYYLLGILNSKLINYLFATRFLNLAIKAEYLKQVRLPLASCEEQQEISHLVKHIIEAKQQLAMAFSTQDKAICQQKVDILDRQINQKVYKLYNLSDDEIQIVEANG